jgi:hypothetical protein
MLAARSGQILLGKGFVLRSGRRAADSPQKTISRERTLRSRGMLVYYSPPPTPFRPGKETVWNLQRLPLRILSSIPIFPWRNAFATLLDGSALMKNSP